MENPKRKTRQGKPKRSAAAPASAFVGSDNAARQAAEQKLAEATKGAEDLGGDRGCLLTA